MKEKPGRWSLMASIKGRKNKVGHVGKRMIEKLAFNLATCVGLRGRSVKDKKCYRVDGVPYA